MKKLLNRFFGTPIPPPPKKIEFDSKSNPFAFESRPSIFQDDSKKQLERYIASMVLASTGDTLGYKNGLWEFCRDGELIHEELQEITNKKGLSALELKGKEWLASDDTLMLLASARAITRKDSNPRSYSSYDNLGRNLADEYIECWKLMEGRAAGVTCGKAIAKLIREKKKENPKYWSSIPFNATHGGCGAAMRSSVFGLMFPDLEKEEQMNRFLEVVVESARMTHHHSTGYLGAVASAYFTSLALQGIPIVQWGSLLLQLIAKVKEYITKTNREVEENLQGFDYFQNAWMKHLELRGIQDGKGPLIFTNPYTVKDRDKYYTSISFDGWGGASGHDVAIIAYDALLGCQGSWEELCSRGILHCGDSDSTGTLACAWWGALMGFEGVPLCNYNNLEFGKELQSLGQSIHQEVFHSTQV